MMRIVHSIPSLVPESGGPARSVTALCTALADVGTQIELLSTDVGRGYAAPIRPVHARITTTLVANSFAVGLRQLWSPRFMRALHQIVANQRVQLMHDHCIWLPTNGAASRVARQAGIPMIVSTRGMLEPWAFAHHGWRKQIMWRLYQKQYLQQTSLLHATSDLEAKNLRRLGLTQPIAVIPNGIDIPVDLPARRNKPVNEGRTLLFLSRIHPKKGLMNLVGAIKQLVPQGWQVVIAGSDENKHLAEVEAAVQKAGLTHMFRFVGSVDDQTKWQYYAQADLFVLPSFSENFGLVVAEALAAGVPVITTHGTPWQELETAQCGWWIKIGMEPLASALYKAMKLSDQERYMMGQIGRQLIQQKYSWRVVADQMTVAYRWLLGNCRKPEFVS